MFNINTERLETLLNHLSIAVPLAVLCLIGLIIVIKLVFKALKTNLPESLQGKSISLFSKVEYCLSFFLGCLVVLEIIFPNSHAALSLSLAALTFALALRLFFYDVLRNLIAGLFIKTNQTIRIGDQLIVTPYHGVVESLGTYNVTLKTADTRVLTLPNSLIFDQHLVIQDPNSLSIENYDVNVGDAFDLDDVQKTLKRTTLAIEGVEPEPGVKALVHGLELQFGCRSVIIRVSWWLNPMTVDAKELRSKVIYSIKVALDDAKIGLNPLKANTSSKPNNISPIK